MMIRALCFWGRWMLATGLLNASAGLAGSRRIDRVAGGYVVADFRGTHDSDAELIAPTR
jgi:hypothetical protein